MSTIMNKKNEVVLKKRQLDALQAQGLLEQGTTYHVSDYNVDGNGNEINVTELQQSIGQKADTNGTYPNMTVGNLLGIKFGSFESIEDYNQAKEEGTLEEGVTYIVKRGE